MKKVAEYKKRIVADLVKQLQRYPIIGLVNMENLPAPQLQRMRAKLRQSVVITMTKKRLIKLALEQARDSKPGLEKLVELMTGMPALIFTKENPFKLANDLKKSKTAAPAKAGQTAPKDIIVPPGPTRFAAGPVISELGSVGIKTGVDAGKVTIKQEFVAAKAGEKISQKVADVLSKLGVEPMEVGLNMVAVYENGLIYERDVLALDQETFLTQLAAAASESTALALYICYPSKETVPVLVAKAFFEAKHLAEVGKVAVTEKIAPAEKKETKVTEEKTIEVEAKEEVKKDATVTIEKTETEKGEAEEEKAAEEKPKEVAEKKIKKEEKPVVEIEGKIKTKISEDFKEDVAEEKARREKMDKEEIENLAQKLKKKGTFREG
jgi:large subunit ribosomal protein L10